MVFIFHYYGYHNNIFVHKSFCLFLIIPLGKIPRYGITRKKHMKNFKLLSVSCQIYRM